MGVVRVAQAQINPTVGDLGGNVAKIGEWVAKARDAGADIVTFPELALCGYPPEDLLLKRRFLDDNQAALRRLLSRCRGISVVVGFAGQEEGRVYNAAALISDGNLLDVYRKIELPNYGVFDEKRYFCPGSSCVVFEIAGVRFSLTICEDIWIPGSTTEACAIQNCAAAVLNISASPFFAGKHALRRQIVARFAKTTGTTLFFNNLIGGQDELVFDGGGMVVNHRGEVVASGRRFEEYLLVTDFQAHSPVEASELWNARKGLHQLPSWSGPERRSPASMAPVEPERLEEIYSALVLGTRDYVSKNGFSKVVIGLSGGIDSALAAAIAVEALGKDQVIGVTMPSHFTSRETLSDAGLLSANLGVRLITVAVRDIFQSYVEALMEPFLDGEPGVENENLQARIRGNILMALSNRFGWMVLTTGNKSETAVGYCTLYGDMAGGFAVIKDVPKILVYELAEYVNRKAGRALIPESIIHRPPSAELRPDQKDEDTLPPYGVLDLILEQYVEEDKATDEIVGFSPETVREVSRMVDRNEYKRRQAPPGVKITPKAFGKDRRLPITNRYANGKIEVQERMKVLVIMHVESEGPGTLGSFLEANNAEVRTARLFAGDTLPANPREVDAVISMGGPMNVYEEDRYPFLGHETAFLRKALAADVPVLGICLGAQMIAKAADAKITKSPEKEVGWGKVYLSDAGRADQLFAGLPEALDVLQWHEDMFLIPDGGSLLASSGPCPHQAFRYGSAVGLQFHVEVSEDILQEWFRDAPELKEIITRYGELKPELSLRAERMYRNFVGLIARRQ